MFIFLWKPHHSYIGIYGCDSPASQSRAYHEKILFYFKRYRPDHRILFQTYITVHVHGNLFFYKLCLKLLFYILQHILKGGRLCKCIAHLDPPEKICHGFRRKKVSQVYRNHQGNRTLLTVSGNLLMNGTDKNCRQICCNGSAVGARLIQNFLYGNGNLQNLHIVMSQHFSLQPHCARIFFFVFRSFRGIILGKAVLLMIPERCPLPCLRFRKPSLRMLQFQIILHQLLKKIPGSRTVGKCMIYFKINTVFIIGNLKQKRFLVRNIKPAARRFYFLLCNSSDISSFQIEPE